VRTSVFYILCLVYLVMLPATVPAQDGCPGWTQWRGSTHHIGVCDLQPPDEMVLHWTVVADQQVQSSPVFFQDTVIMGSDDGRLYGIHRTTGEVMWRYTAGASIQATALIVDAMAYFGDLDGSFHCIELPSQPDGSPREVWTHSCGGSIISSAHMVEDFLVFGCSDGSIYCLDLDGDLVWNTLLGGDIWGSPLVDLDTNTAFLGTSWGHYYAVDLGSGAVLWDRDLGGDFLSSGCYHDGVIYIPNGVGRTLYALDAVDGSTVWDMYLGFESYSTPSYLDGRLYFSSYEYAWCVPADDPDGNGTMDTGDISWRAETHDFEGGSSPLVTNSRVFVGSQDGNLYCFERGSGALVWNYTTEGYVYSSPALWDGVVFFASTDGTMNAVGDRPARLSVELSVSVPEITSNGKTDVDVVVLDQFGQLVEGAGLVFEVSSGDLEGGFETDSNGEAHMIYSPLDVSSRSTISIAVTAVKDGMPNGTDVAFLVVEPAADTDESGVDLDMDRSGARRPYLTLLVIAVVFNLILTVALFRARRLVGGVVP